MASNPFADLIPGGGATPGYIPGRPKAPTPLQLSAEQRAVEDQSMQRQQFAETMRRQDRTEARLDRNDQRQAAKDAEGTEGERTAAFLATRLAGSWNDIKRITQENPAAASPELDTAILGRVTGNSFTNSSERQRVEDAQLDVLDAALTLGTGAAYTREQLEGYRQSYFPQYWDSPEAVRDKASRLDRVLQAARIKAGRAAPMIDAALKNESAIPANGANGGRTLTDEEKRQGYTLDAGGNIISPDNTLVVDVEGGRTPEQEADIARRSQTGALGAAVMGAGDTLSFGLLDEAGAAAEAAFGAGNGSFSDRYSRALDTNRAVQQRVQDQNGGSYLAGQISGGFALPSFGARSVAQLARLGGGYGAAYGAGSADGGVGDRAIGAAVGGGTGAALGGGLGWLLRAGANRLGGGAGGGGGGAELAQAAARQGVDVLPADVGGPMTRRFTAAAAQGPLSAGPIIRGGQRAAEQMQGARDRIAGAVGNAVDPVEAGEAVSTAARGFAGRTSARGGALYDEAANLAGDARVTPDRARTVLNEQIARMEQVPGGGAGLEQARALLNNLEGNFTVQGIRDMRTEMFVAPELRGTPASARLRQVVDAAADDVANSLEQQGRGEAAAAFRRADRYWRARIETIDQTIEPIIGSASNPKSGEQVVQSLMTAGRTNSARLNRFVQSLPADEQATLRATVISQLGRASAGTQDDVGGAFSANQFLTHWNQLTPRAKDVLFRGEARDALNDLARIANGTREAQGYANRSNTGGAMFGNIGGWLGVGTLSPAAATFGVAGQMVSGRLLASPRFARWLARPARTPEEVQRQAGRLSAIAAREPAIANDILPIQRALQEALPVRAAANDQEQNRR